MREDFFKLATQYYAAGRWALHTPLMPVGPNLLHHAVEMYLKAHLCQTMTTHDLQEKIRHSLTKAWNKFKRVVKDPHLTRFDSVIHRLNQFENLRYPDKVSKKGSCVVWSPTPEKVFIHTTDAQVPQYKLILSEIDELIEAVIGKSGINLEFFKIQLSREALEVLKQDNCAAIWN